jgi:hypothetical protein
MKTKKQNKFKYKKFEVTASFEESGVKFPNTDKKDNTLHNRFTVTVTNKENGDVIDFDFYGSHHDYENNKSELSVEDLKHAFYSFISDSLSGLQDYEDFCKEFGYDEDSRKAFAIHEACIESFEKTEELGITEEELYELANELND